MLNQLFHLSNQFFKLAKKFHSSSFSLQELDSFPTYLEKEEYLKSVGLEPFQKDAGSSRQVFILSPKKVLKLAKGRVGNIQNKNEWEVLNKHKEDIFPKTYQHGPLFSWIIVELIRPLKDFDELKKTLDIDISNKDYGAILFEMEKHSTFQEYVIAKLKYIKSYLSILQGREEKIKMFLDLYNNKKFVDFINKIKQTGLQMGDLFPENLGINSSGKLVILDAGLTPEIYNKYYLSK